MTIERIIDGRTVEIELTYSEVMRIFNQVTEDNAITTLESVLGVKWYKLTEKEKHDGIDFYLNAMAYNMEVEEVKMKVAQDTLWFLTHDIEDET